MPVSFRQIELVCKNIVSVITTIMFCIGWVNSFFIPADEYIVKKVSDGDTITVTQKGKDLKVRLAYIDAPEKLQDYGQESKKSLEKYFRDYGKKVRIEFQKNLDGHGRYIGEIFVAGESVNRIMVLEGKAHAYMEYGGKKFIKEYEEARRKKKGLWGTGKRVELPKDYRKRIRLQNSK